MQDETNIAAPDSVAPDDAPSDQSPSNLEPKERIVTVAIELFPDTTTSRPPQIVNISDFMLQDLHPLLPHDLSESTDPTTGGPSGSHDDERYCYSVPSVRRLWNIFRVGLDILFSQKRDTPLSRLPPPGEAFLAYANTLISRAEVCERTNGTLQGVVEVNNLIAGIRQDLPCASATKGYRVSNASLGSEWSDWTESSSAIDSSDISSISEDFKAALEKSIGSWREEITEEQEVEFEENIIIHPVETTIKLLIVNVSEMDQLLELRSASSKRSTLV